METISESAEKGSDAYVPHFCNPCKYLESYKEATAYCGHCNTFLCKSCEQSHRGLPSTRNHDLMTGKMLSTTPNPSPFQFVTYCDDHKGYLINGFCETHKTLICDVCSSITHRKCLRTALRDKASKIGKSQMRRMVGRINQIKQMFEMLKSSREKDAELMIKQTKNLVDDIKEQRRIIDENLDDLEKDAYEYIEDVRNGREKELRNQVTRCETILKQLDERIKEMQDYQASMNDEIKFIGLTKSYDKVNEMENIFKDMESESTQFQLVQSSKIVEDILQKMKKLNHVIPTFKRTDISSKESILDMKVSSQQNIKIYADWISGSTFLPCGNLVICDRGNKKLQLFSPIFNSLETIDLPSRPCDICTVSETEVAVTFPEQQMIQFVTVQPRMIQFVTVQPRLKLRQSLRVDKTCWGIDCHGGMMYVTCHNNPGNGEILVMSMDGQVQRRLGLDKQGRCMFSSAHNVRVSRVSERMYVSDLLTKTVTCMTMNGTVVYQYTHKDLSRPHAIHVDSQDNVLVCGSESDNIHRVDKHGNYHSILLCKSDGVVFPICLSYRDADGALVIGMSNVPACKVFWLKK